MFGSGARKLPVVLPTDLLAWLVEKDRWPGREIRSSDIAEYWKRATDHNQPWAEGVDPRSHPLYLWGDDAQYDEKGSKLILVVLGHCLDEQTNSLLSCFPLFCIRADP